MIFLTMTNGGGAAAKPRLMVVEDDGPSRMALVQILKMQGYDVLAAPTLAEAMAQLGQKPSWIILDLMLPDGNGMDILRRIRQQNLPIRVAIVTGADKPMVAEAHALRPDALFTKPVDLMGLIDWLKAA